MPTVSVIMNCHNGARYLVEAINSVYTQTYQDFEIIFYDNVSSDNSVKLAALYDERLKIYKNDGDIKTLGHARKEAVRHARGEWLAFLDTDDIWMPEKLQKQMSALSRGEYVLAYAGVENIDANGSHIRMDIPKHSSGNLFGCLLQQFEVNMPTAIVSKVFMDDRGLNFDPLMEASEEYNLFMQIAADGKVLVLKDILAKYRVHETSLTFEKMEKWAFERRYTLELLERTRPNLVKHYNSGFIEATSRAMYYDACSLMRQGKLTRAREELKKASNSGGVKYRLLNWLTYFPSLWRFLHKSSIKPKISSLLRRIE